ncbi:MAG TPA: DDE-type integrase/transposase/recombinase [Streptosporangiaceae bacterium]
MSPADDEDARVRRARAVALFRYALIREAADPALSTRQRGRLVRELAARPHAGPFGEPVTVSRPSLDRWIRAWRSGGFDALAPPSRHVTPRTPAEVLDLAVALKRENPARTAAQVARVLRASGGWSPSERTLQRHFARLELTSRPDGSPPPAFGRFEAARCNEMWTGDALHGPVIAGRKTYLFAFIDDHSRLITGHRFGHAEDTVRLAAALRPALASRGVPERIYVDNGSAFVDAWLLRACAVLGIRLTHSTPRRPRGRGKIERLFLTVREQFLVEITGDPGQGGRRHVTSIAELNRLFTAWAETAYHRRVHSETGQAPFRRWAEGPAGTAPPLPEPAQLHEAFLWSEHRTVRKTATVALHGNTYQVDPSLTGRKVELAFDPFDLTGIDVRWQGRPAGQAIPHVIGRHARPRARPEQPVPPAPATGIDYLALIDAARDTRLAGAAISFAGISDPPSGPGGPAQLPGQLTIDEAITGEEL